MSRVLTAVGSLASPFFDAEIAPLLIPLQNTYPTIPRSLLG